MRTRRLTAGSRATIRRVSIEATLANKSSMNAAMSLVSPGGFSLAMRTSERHSSISLSRLLRTAFSNSSRADAAPLTGRDDGKRTDAHDRTGDGRADFLGLLAKDIRDGRDHVAFANFVQ